jgi:hypothetical protein
MSKVFKTINPLHFEDLEPHRFEVLVRQLLYDFKKWVNLEATGVGGSDDGFDARGWEDYDVEEVEEVENDDKTQPIKQKRIWLIQCKREKVITPKKIEKYVRSIKIDKGTPIYGIIFVAACDFSKQTRDKFISLIRDKGFKEFHLWGKREIEDMLFQPKNDHLLFAYFGISLKLRERSLKTLLRSKLSIKRKSLKQLQKYDSVLIRDINDTYYPNKSKINDKKFHWRVFRFNGHCYAGIKIVINKFFAFLELEKGKDIKLKKWDMYDSCNDAVIDSYDNPWLDKKDENNHYEKRNLILRYWYNMPEDKRGMLIEEGVIPYERIIAIDENGDEFLKKPHIYIQLNEKGKLFDGFYYYLESNLHLTTYHFNPDDKKRVNYFPKKIEILKKKVKEIEKREKVKREKESKEEIKNN